jgi:hypothetical protein
LTRYHGGALRLLQRLEGLLKGQSAGDGEMDGALGALKELGAELALEHLVLLRQGRLGDAEALCRAAEVKLFGQHDQIPELTKLHAVIPATRSGLRSKGITSTSTSRRHLPLAIRRTSQTQ